MTSLSCCANCGLAIVKARSFLGRDERSKKHLPRKQRTLPGAFILRPKKRAPLRLGEWVVTHSRLIVWVPKFLVIVLGLEVKRSSGVKISSRTRLFTSRIV